MTRSSLVVKAYIMEWINCKRSLETQDAISRKETLVIRRPMIGTTIGAHESREGRGVVLYSLNHISVCFQLSELVNLAFDYT